MASINKYFIGPSLLGDIRRTINRVDSETYRVNGGMRREVHQEMMQPPGGGASLRFVSWTQTWNATATATFTFKGGTQTATAVNAFAGVGPGDGWVARHQGTWHLAVVNLTMQPSYTSGEIQLLGHGDDGILNWYSVTQCGSTAT
jgi:hypothetical protein